jgi:hypothetical protein
MTTKKYSELMYKQTKNVINMMFERIFDDYIVYRNGKRIGYLFNNKFYLIATENLQKILPNVAVEHLFGNEITPDKHIILIENTEDAEFLKTVILAVYNDLHFHKDFVTDISYLFAVNCLYPDSQSEIYDLHITFLKFCYEKGLLKKNPIDKQNRILYMNYNNMDLTEKGHKIFHQLHTKWLIYTDKNDEKSAERNNNVKMLEKYYAQLTKE